MKKMLILIAGCILFLSGCTKSNIVAPSLAVEPETDIKEGIEIDWDQVLAGLDETFLNLTPIQWALKLEQSLILEINMLS